MGKKPADSGRKSQKKSQKNLPKVFMDTCVILDYFQKTKGKYEFIKPIIDKAEADELIIVCSSLALSEITYIKTDNDEVHRPPTEEETAAIEEFFFRRKYIVPVAADALVCALSRRLQYDDRFDVDHIDSIHVASAAMNKIPIMLTYDGEGEKNPTPVLALNYMIHLRDAPVNPTLRIMTPEDYWREDPHKLEMFGSPHSTKDTEKKKDEKK